MKHKYLRSLPGITTIIALAVAVPSVNAQQANVFANPSNLIILPEDISPEDLASQMRRFKLALGVECSHCHVGTDNRRYTDFDFAADNKETKRIARKMMHMVSAINGMVTSLERGPDHQVMEVNCVTCHRGNFRPVMIKDELITSYAASDGDIEAVIGHYEELRKQHFGGFAYDFGEFPVSAMAFTLNKEGHAEDAIKLQKMNAKYHPESPNIPSGMGFIFREMGQLDLAAEAFRKSIEIDPTGRWAAKQLAEVEALLSAGNPSSNQ